MQPWKIWSIGNTQVWYKFMLTVEVFIHRNFEKNPNEAVLMWLVSWSYHGEVIFNQITKKRGNKWAIWNKSMTEN